MTKQNKFFDRNSNEVYAMISATETALQVLLGYAVNIRITKAQDPAKKIKMTDIISAVCESFDVSVQDVQGPSRKQEFVLPRMAICHIAYTHGVASLVQIGTVLGGRNHATVIHAIKQVDESLLVTDEEFQNGYWNARDSVEQVVGRIIRPKPKPKQRYVPVNPKPKKEKKPVIHEQNKVSRIGIGGLI